MRHRVLHMASLKQAVAVLSICFVGCSSPVPNPLAGTAWGAATVVEELAIGVEFGADEHMFGSVRSIAVAADGTMYVSDGQPTIVRAYDSDGSFLRNIGGQGQGPGEYNGSPALRLHADGRLVMWDYQNSRVSFFSAQGDYLDSFPGTSGFGGHNSLQVDVAGDLYVRIFNREADSEADQLLLRYSTAGEQLDRIEPPSQDAEGLGFYLSAEGSIGAFQVMNVSAWSPLGYVVTGRNDVYDIELRGAEETVHVRRDLDPIAVRPEERAEWEAFRQTLVDRNRARNRDVDFDPDPIPNVKPFFRDIYVGEDGRIWVSRFVAAEKRLDVEPLPDRPERPLLTWREPWTYDVFEPDGTFLGSVVVPELFRPFVFRGERIWGALVGEDGVERVIRLRVVPEVR